VNKHTKGNHAQLLVFARLWREQGQLGLAAEALEQAARWRKGEVG
jgi:hypothetical protein